MKFILNRKIRYYAKEGLKGLYTVLFATIIIISMITTKYKIAYEVKYNDGEIGIVNDKNEINKAIENYTDNKSEEIASIELKSEPEYVLKFVDKDTKTNDEEVLSSIKNEAITTYRRFAIVLEGEQKAIVSSLEEAETVVQEIKKEFNKDLELDLTVTEIYDTESTNVESKDVALAKLNEDETVQTRLKEQESMVNGVVLNAPISGVITSRFGSRSSGYHNGLDIAASTGTPIGAAAPGTVTFAGWQNLYGNLVIISHENGVVTYYAHCSKIYVKKGQTVEKGETIAAVGSTGNSTGPHLHLEIWVDGVRQNPQKYLYK